MKGLLIKDYYMARKYTLFMAALGVLYSVLGTLEGSEGSGFLALFVFLYMGILSCTVLNLEEKSHWEQYCVMLPCTRVEMVAEKYILALIGVGIGCLLYVAVNAALIATGMSILSWDYVWIMTAIGAGMGILLPSISLPWMFRFGGAKGRIFMIITIGVIAAALGILTGASGSGEESGLAIIAGLGSRFTVVFALAALGITAVSFLISVGLYRKREL